MPTFSAPLKIAISYAHEDEGLKEKLLEHLSTLYRQGIVIHWHDRDLKAGEDWAELIDDKFEEAAVVLLLISPAFINSRYCYEVEMTRALARHAAESCRVIPIALRPCSWGTLPFARLQALPKDAVPVTTWPNQDQAFTDIVEGLRETCTELIGHSEQEEQSSTLPQVLSSPSKTKAEKITDDSGALVMLGNRFYESRTVTELDRGHVEIEIVSSSSEEEADLRALHDGQRFSSRHVPYAHANEGFMAQVNSSKSQSTAGVRTWRIDITPVEESQNHLLDMGFNGLTPQEIAAMRARFLLLGEKPGRLDSNVASILTGWIQGRGENEVKPILRQLWKSEQKEDTFLRRARLQAVYWLKKLGICQDILELRLGPLQNHHVQVKFKGRRSSNWTSSPILVEVEGCCPLK